MSANGALRRVSPECQPCGWGSHEAGQHEIRYVMGLSEQNLQLVLMGGSGYG
jgi:hypothetical protein